MQRCQNQFDVSLIAAGSSIFVEAEDGCNVWLAFVSWSMDRLWQVGVDGQASFVVAAFMDGLDVLGDDIRCVNIRIEISIDLEWFGSLFRMKS